MKQSDDPIIILEQAGIAIPEEARAEIREAMLKLMQLSAKLAQWKAS